MQLAVPLRQGWRGVRVKALAVVLLVLLVLLVGVIRRDIRVGVGRMDRASWIGCGGRGGGGGAGGDAVSAWWGKGVIVVRDVVAGWIGASIVSCAAVQGKRRSIVAGVAVVASRHASSSAARVVAGVMLIIACLAWWKNLSLLSVCQSWLRRGGGLRVSRGFLAGWRLYAERSTSSSCDADPPASGGATTWHGLVGLLSPKVAMTRWVQ